MMHTLLPVVCPNHVNPCEDTLIREARHAYQNAQAAAPGNDDDDLDWLVKSISVAPTNSFLDSTSSGTVCDQAANSQHTRTYHGDTTFDSYEAHDFASQARHMDAWVFASQHANN